MVSKFRSSKKSFCRFEGLRGWCPLLAESGRLAVRCLSTDYLSSLPRALTLAGCRVQRGQVRILCLGCSVWRAGFGPRAGFRIWP